MTPKLAPLLAAAALVLATGCHTLGQAAQLLRDVGPMPSGAGVAAALPTITFETATLVEAPGKAALAAWYCPQVTGMALPCQIAFGPPPPVGQLRVSFDLRFRVHNPNRFPVPVAELLTAATVFPQASNQRLGAACVQLCAPGSTTCAGTPGPQACQSRSTDLRSARDLVEASGRLLLAAGLTALSGGQPTFQMPQVTQEADLTIQARFSFGPEALLGVLRQLADQAAQQLQKGQQPTFTIPYRLQGAAWLDVGSLGRVEVGFGPASGTWTLPTQALQP
jgi:hypothetical protein